MLLGTGDPKELMWELGGEVDPTTGSGRRSIRYDGVGFSLVIERADRIDQRKVYLRTDTARFPPVILRDMRQGNYAAMLWFGARDHEMTVGPASTRKGEVSITGEIQASILAAVAARSDTFWIGMFSLLEEVLFQEEVHTTNLRDCVRKLCDA
jgi:hypothetical protein